MCDSDGWVLEGTTANVLIVDPAGKLLTPPAHKVLPGISLGMVRELAQQRGREVAERDISVADFSAASEALLVSTSPCILPVTRLNGRNIGKGQPGEVFHTLIASWSRAVGIDIVAQASTFANSAPPIAE